MIYVLRNQEVGHGHWYRALALAEAAELRGYQVVLLSDHRNDQHNTVLISSALNAPRLAYALTRHSSDWLLYDTPQPPAAYLVQMAHDYDCRVAWLDAGPDDPPYCDLNWVQDQPTTVILRTDLQYARYEPNGRWLVFGGAADRLGLIKRFATEINEPAWLVTAESEELLGQAYGDHVLVRNPQSMVNIERHARRACLAMGQTAWECARLGVPLYLFSLDEKHLATARKLATWGYARHWDDVGLPDTWALKTFLAQEFIPRGPTIAGGADNLLNALMEKDS